MREVFELLHRRGLTSEEQIESKIMHGWSIKDILDFNAELLDTIEVTHPAETDLTAFNFIANSDMTAQRGTCINWDCRLRRVENLARFAALYADRVYIENYFFDYTHPSAFMDELLIRYCYTGDLKILLRLRPVLENDVLALVQPLYHICPQCAQEVLGAVKDIDTKIDKYMDGVREHCLPQTSVTAVYEPHLAGDYEWALHIEAPEDLFDHGTAITVRELPDWLLAKMKPAANSKPPAEYKLSKANIRKIGVVDERLDRIGCDIYAQHLASRTIDTKYLTNRSIDIAFLRSVTEDEDFARYNDVLGKYLMYELPMLPNVHLPYLLDLRRHEHDAFLVYRNSINQIVRTYVKDRKTLSASDAKAIYEDLVYPQLCRLNTKVETIRRSLREKAKEEILVTAGVLSFGLFSGLLPPDLKGVFAAIGGFKIATDLLTTVLRASRTPHEIRNDNFYFLWRLAAKAS